MLAFLQLWLESFLRLENRILRNQVKGRLLLSDGEKTTLAEIAKRLGRKALTEIAVGAKPDTILGWFRKLVARKFDGSQARRKVGLPWHRAGRGRPGSENGAGELRVGLRFRIIGALANLGHKIF